MVMKLGRFGKWIRGACKVVKCGAGEGGEDHLDRLCEKEKMSECRRVEGYLAYSKKEGKLSGLATSCVGTACQNTLLKAR